MVRIMLCSLISACLATNQLVHAAEYGVGFSLSLDYGTGSIHFSNGTAVDVAKVWGSPAYKHLMRTTDVLDIDAIAHRKLPADGSAPYDAGAQKGLGLRSFHDYVPPWLGGHGKGSPPLQWMLKALKTTTEAYLEDTLSDVEVVVPFPVAESFLDTLRSTCSSLSLNMPMSAQPPAGILAARAAGIGGQCSAAQAIEPSESNQQDGPEQLILTVDYSHAALTALLVAEECSIFECRRVVHDTSISADACDAFSREGTTPESQTCRENLRRAIEGIVRLPLREGNGAGLTQISELVLLGEAAGLPLLQDVLKETLGEHHGRLLAVSLGKPTESLRLSFIASRELAFDCWDRLNFQGREDRGCEL